MPYLMAHFKISAFLILFVLFLEKVEFSSNRLRLVLLYLILMKSILPWGIVDFSLFHFLQTDYDEVVSFDPSSDMGLERENFIFPVLTGEHLLIILWVFLSLLYFAFILQGLFKLGATVKKAPQCEDIVTCELMADLMRERKKQSNISVLVSPEIETPLIWWFRKWLIVLPEPVISLSRMEKKVILAHEFTHIRRHDFIKFFLLKGVTVLFFFSPLVKVVINNILFREEMETDSEAMRSFGITPKDFGQTILHVLSISNSVKYLVPTLIKPTKRKLKMRLEGLFQKEATKKVKLIQTNLIVAALIMLALNFHSTVVAGKDAASGEFINPLMSSRITLGFGPATHPITQKKIQHNGIDLAIRMGTGIVSPADGQVLEVNYDDIRGHYLVLRHHNGYATLYSHLSEIKVVEGSSVVQGKEIATVGNSGLSTGPHLHFEVRKDNKVIDPQTLIRF